ncbi:MAG: endo alpha-1,4 polygalactosaminidase [Spirochaetes bacterium]|nr:endo alpha-1,4 polygalactosaminidase [Spirochaetota bacterium]
MQKETNKIITTLIIISTALLINIDYTFGKTGINYRQEMRDLVMLISSRAKQNKQSFYIVPQNALDIITADGSPEGRITRPYLDSIDGTGCEELFYGHGGDGIKNTKRTSDYFLNYLQLYKQQNKKILVIDYITNKTQALNSFRLCKDKGFISFQANRDLTRIPSWNFNMNNNDINTLSEADNFLFLLNTSAFKSRKSYIDALKKTEYDLIVVDAFFWEKILTREEVSAIQKKPSGRKRLVIAYMSIGEAETYRYYWHRDWGKYPPSFLERENPEWEGNYKVKYWHEEWKEIMCGKSDGTGFEKSYLKKIINTGFDGVYMDIIDAAYYFENIDKY